MTTLQTAETSHKDNLFGVCNALGEDFGFNPLYLRLALAVAFLFRPEIVVVGYFAVGLVVLAARLVFPNAKPAPVAAVVVAEEAPEAEAFVEYARAA